MMASHRGKQKGAVGCMSIFRKKQKMRKEFDRDLLEPALRCSICTGEQTAGFRNKRTGEFKEVCLIRNEKELQEFLDMYGLSEIEKFY